MRPLLDPVVTTPVVATAVVSRWVVTAPVVSLTGAAVVAGLAVVVEGFRFC
jgi:hypothetical protein